MPSEQQPSPSKPANPVEITKEPRKAPTRPRSRRKKTVSLPHRFWFSVPRNFLLLRCAFRCCASLLPLPCPISPVQGGHAHLAQAENPQECALNALGCPRPQQSLTIKNPSGDPALVCITLKESMTFMEAAGRLEKIGCDCFTAVEKAKVQKVA